MFSFFQHFKKPSVVIRHRQDHNISRKNISPEALRVLYTLSDAGYKAYLVGGGVRDLLLGRRPKDFDVGTDARPNEIKRLFRRCFLVGRRFRLAHVVIRATTIETSTFRKQPPHEDDVDENGSLYQDDDNTFGTPEEDAFRRDFTVNGLFYDISTFDVIDYVGGLKDLDRRVLRSIGDPNIRFQEDPVRMMRAIRLSSKLGLTIERGTLKAIHRHYREIEKASGPRLLEEIFRLFAYGTTEPCFRRLWETGLLSVLMPKVDRHINESGGKKSDVWRYLAAFDEITKGMADEDISNGLRIAAVYLGPFLAEIEKRGVDPRDKGRRLAVAADVISTMDTRYKVPKSAQYHATHLLQELSLFEKAPFSFRPVRPSRALQFLDALRLARVRAAVGGHEKELAAWERLAPGPVPDDVRSGRNEPDDDAADAPRPEEGGEGFRPRRRRRPRRQNRPFRDAPGEGAPPPPDRSGRFAREDSREAPPPTA